VRATTWDYHFSTWEEHRQTGAWWHREIRGTYLPPVGLRTTANRHVGQVFNLRADFPIGAVARFPNPRAGDNPAPQNARGD